MSQIVNRVAHYLLKKDIIKLSKIEDSFYSYKRLDKRVTLNREVIALNYLSDSPYPTGETKIVVVSDRDALYLWYSRGEFKHYLPEALLLFRNFSKKHDNLILIVHDEIDKIIVIKERELLSSFSKHSLGKHEMHLLQSEYAIEKIVTLEKESYQSALDDGFNALEVGDIFSILDVKLDVKSLFNRLVSFSAIPLFISTVTLLVALFIYNGYLETQNSNLFNQFKESKELTSSIKAKIIKIEELDEMFNSLLDEFKSEDKALAISSIIEVSRDLNMTLFYISSYDKSIDFIVNTEEASTIPLFTQKLFETALFSNIKNVSSQKVKGKLTKVTMRATLGERE